MGKRPVDQRQCYLRELLLLQVLRHGRVEVFGVTFVQAVDLPSFLDLHVSVHQDELAERLRSRGDGRSRAADPVEPWATEPAGETDRVQHEAVDSLTGGEDDHGGAAVKGVTRRHQVSAGLQGVLLTRLVVCGLTEHNVTRLDPVRPSARHRTCVRTFL